MSPEVSEMSGTVKDKASTEQNDRDFARMSDEVKTQGRGTALRDSPDDSDYGDGGLGLPIRRLGNDLRHLDDSFSYEVKKSKKSLENISDPEGGLNGGENLVLQSSKPIPSSPFMSSFFQHHSSNPLSQPPGNSRSVVVTEHGTHPYFHHPRELESSGGRGQDENLSIRVGNRDFQNITQRDDKRPKERPKDRTYKARFSMVSSSDMVVHRPVPNFYTGYNANGDAGNDYKPTPAPSEFRCLGGGYPPELNAGQTRGGGVPSSSHGSYEIFLTYSGTRITHRVWDSMPVSQLTVDACSIFGLKVDEVLLMLFSSSPTSLPMNGRISGPPRVGPGSTVMIFHVPGSALNQHRISPTQDSPLPQLGSKLLATFKLPKFDGVAKSWKPWEKSFQRFLGIHQLDHVLEEHFLDTLWTAPGAKAANKMVYFLVEDAVAPGTLASRLVRQATKWNGHEAFVLLRNGYVFNGPQTATILLAELSKIRLKRDEDASTFCLRLVELIEDLELIPGDAAVFLTDTQKLGYLLSAIRHEHSLQSVYSQLQSEQLRGTITFDQACRELHHRVEAMRADDFLDSRPGRALISTEGQKNGQRAVPVVKLPCLAKDCKELIQPYLPLCKLCYLQCMAGKIPSLTLRDNLGNATFNSRTQKLEFPPSVPPARFPKKGMKKGKKLLVPGVPLVGGDSSSD
jgi:hypothetical protein